VVNLYSAFHASLTEATRILSVAVATLYSVSNNRTRKMHGITVWKMRRLLMIICREYHHSSAQWLPISLILVENHF